MSVPARRRQVAFGRERGLSARRACTLFSVARSALGYQGVDMNIRSCGPLGFDVCEIRLRLKKTYLMLASIGCFGSKPIRLPQILDVSMNAGHQFEFPELRAKPAQRERA